MLLERFGYTVLSSTSAEDVQKLVSNHCPAMLLMDDSYPGVDFKDIAKQGKGACPEMVIVVLSPYYYGGRNRADGAIDCFITNEEGPHVLISHIEELLGRGSAEQNANSRAV
jgi:CheY-like chemotaxis protein